VLPSNRRTVRRPKRMPTLPPAPCVSPILPNRGQQRLGRTQWAQWARWAQVYALPPERKGNRRHWPKKGIPVRADGGDSTCPAKCTTGSDTVATPQRRTATPQTGWAGPGSLGIRRPTHEVPSCRQNDRLQGGGKCWQGRQNEPRRRTTPLQLANCPLLILTTTPEVVGGAAMAGMSSSEARNARSRSRGRNRANLVHRPFGSGKGAERATDRPISPDHSNKLLPLFQEMAAAQRTRANDRR